MLCYGMLPLCYVVSCYALLRGMCNLLCFVMSLFVTLFYVIGCNVILCYVMVRYMLYYVVSCYLSIVIFYIIICMYVPIYFCD